MISSRSCIFVAALYLFVGLLIFFLPVYCLSLFYLWKATSTYGSIISGKRKNYIEDPYIADSWNYTKQCLQRAYMFTIFGYSVPKTDVSAISLLQEAWGSTDERKFEEVEIIDIREEDELRGTWDSFIYTQHYSTHSNYFSSSLGILPRRSCEATFDRLMK